MTERQKEAVRISILYASQNPINESMVDIMIDYIDLIENLEQTKEPIEFVMKINAFAVKQALKDHTGHELPEGFKKGGIITSNQP